MTWKLKEGLINFWKILSDRHFKWTPILDDILVWVNCSAQAAAKCRNCKCKWYSDFRASLSLCKPSEVVFIDNYTTACNCTKYPQIFLISSNIFTGFGNSVRFGGVHDSYSDQVSTHSSTPLCPWRFGHCSFRASRTPQLMGGNSDQKIYLKYLFIQSSTKSTENTTNISWHISCRIPACFILF